LFEMFLVKFTPGLSCLLEEQCVSRREEDAVDRKGQEVGSCESNAGFVLKTVG
jgi:hypothetical protein